MTDARIISVEHVIQNSPPLPDYPGHEPGKFVDDCPLCAGVKRSGLRDEAAPSRERVLEEALRGLLAEVVENTCQHEDVYRGGTIWTICRDCGCKWADDRGGFKPYADSKAVADARQALAAKEPK